MNKFGFKRGWTLVELSVALIALGILIGVSIQVLKPQRVLVSPFAYAGLKNLVSANQYILTKCQNAFDSYASPKVVGCTESKKLPDIEGKEDEIKAEYGDDNLYDSYCFEVGNAFSIMPGKTTGTSGMNCKTTDATYLPSGSTPGKANFQATNLVAYYFLERPWVTIERAMPVESDSDDTMYETEPSKFKEIFIDVNGDDPPNALGEDQFALRVYITGEVIPSHCTTSDYGEGLTSSVCPSKSSQYNWLISPFPFSYDLYRSGGTGEDVTDPETGETSERRITKRVQMAKSYKEAACHSGRDILVPRKQFCGEEGASNDYSTYTECKGDTEETAFCVTRLSKPSSPGMFQLPI